MTTGTISGTDARDQFLHLLVTQLQYQDPLEPTSQEDFISQLAQFSTLEGIDKLNVNFEQMLKVQELTQGAQLVGRTAEYITNDGTAQGVIESAYLLDGELVLNIDGLAVPLNDVIGIVQSTV